MRKYFKIFKINFLSELMYLRNYLGRFAFFGVIIYILSFLWKEIFAQKGAIEGFDFIQIMWYFMLTESIMLAKENIYIQITEDVRSGDIAYHLNKPYSYPIFYLSKYLSTSLVRFIMNVIVGTGVLTLIIKKCPLTPETFLLGIIVAIGGLVLNYVFFFLIGIISFWMEDTSSLNFIYSKILFTVGGLFIPLEFFPGWVRTFADSLPFKYILYAPAKVFITGNQEFFYIFIGQWLNIGIYSLLIYLLYINGVKKLNVNGG